MITYSSLQKYLAIEKALCWYVVSRSGVTTVTVYSTGDITLSTRRLSSPVSLFSWSESSGLSQWRLLHVCTQAKSTSVTLLQSWSDLNADKTFFASGLTLAIIEKSDWNA